MQGCNIDMLLRATRSKTQRFNDVQADWHLFFDAEGAKRQGLTNLFDMEQGAGADSLGCQGTWQNHTYTSQATAVPSAGEAAGQASQRKYAHVREVRFNFGDLKCRCAVPCRLVLAQLRTAQAAEALLLGKSAVGSRQRLQRVVHSRQTCNNRTGCSTDFLPAYADAAMLAEQT